MVVILFVLFIELIGMAQERCTSPSMWTEQAPHCAIPQPYLVPVNPSCSRNTHSNGISPSAFTSTVFPFTFNFTMVGCSDALRVPTLLASAQERLCSHSRASTGRPPIVGEEGLRCRCPAGRNAAPKGVAWPSVLSL